MRHLRATPRRRRFTLVELLVAMVLMTILTGSVVFIFIQAQDIFVTVDAKVQVYQYARYAFDQMERDLANVIRSRNMEFFNDQAPPAGLKGHYDMGEEIPIRGTANRDADPQGDTIFNHSFTLRQPAPYTDLRDTKHRADSIYFKTVATVDGKTQAALIEYALIDRDKVRPKLQKRLWRVTGVDGSNPLAPRYQINGGNAEPTRQDLCLYLMDCTFEIFVKNNRRGHAGDYFSAQQLTAPPRVPGTTVEVFEPHHNYWGGQNFMVQAFYDENHEDRRMQPDLGVFEPSEKGLFRTQAFFTFPMLKEGDTIFLYGAGSGFKSKAYRIKAFVKRGTNPPEAWQPDMDKADFRIQFEEPIEGLRNSRLNVRYAAAWVPPALRVTLKIKDSKSLQNRSVSRVFKILAE